MIDFILRMLWIYIPLRYIKVIHSGLECFLIFFVHKLASDYTSARVN